MVAVDAMGGDFAPEAVVNGSYQAACEGVSVNLFGSEKEIIRLLNLQNKCWHRYKISITHCDDFIRMCEVPTRSILKRKETTLFKALESVSKKESFAFVSAGNSGAVFIFAMIFSGRIAGLKRAAFGNFLPTSNGSVFVLDLGANANCKPEYIFDFASMGHVYVSMEKGISRPRIALLSNGHESYKGSDLTQQTYKLLSKSKLNFVGNIEPKQIFTQDLCDVVVTDGFSGNILLKSVQAAASVISNWFKKEHKSSFLKYLSYVSNITVYNSIKRRANNYQKGGALVLGVNDPIIIAHGCSDALAIKSLCSWCS